MKNFIIFCVVILSSSSNLFCQTRIAILPFNNMDGNAIYNIWCYNLQDSLASKFAATDPTEKYYRVVPMDSVEALLAEMNLDPTNPQYLSDLWLAVEKLNVEHVITGNFKIQAKRFLINAYIYNVATKLPNIDHQVRNIFKREDKVYEAVPLIVNTLSKAYIPD